MLRQNLYYDYSKLPKSTMFKVDYIQFADTKYTAVSNPY